MTTPDRSVSLAWLDRIACADMDPERFVVRPGQLGPSVWTVLARCDRCPVIKQCCAFHKTLHKKRSVGIVAGGMIFGVRRTGRNTGNTQNWRELSPDERARFEEWMAQARTTEARALESMPIVRTTLW